MTPVLFKARCAGNCFLIRSTLQGEACIVQIFSPGTAQPAMVAALACFSKMFKSCDSPKCCCSLNCRYGRAWQSCSQPLAVQQQVLAWSWSIGWLAKWFFLGLLLEEKRQRRMMKRRIDWTAFIYCQAETAMVMDCEPAWALKFHQDFNGINSTWGTRSLMTGLFMFLNVFSGIQMLAEKHFRRSALKDSFRNPQNGDSENTVPRAVCFQNEFDGIWLPKEKITLWRLHSWWLVPHWPAWT